jgi:hypothetical protein
LVVTACVDEPLEAAPGEPVFIMAPSWFHGERNVVKLGWPNARSCGMDDWGCREPTTTMTVLEVACSGCTILDDPTGKTSGGRLELVAAATDDDEILVEVKIRFDATGSTRWLSQQAIVDHEVALDAQCKLISTSELVPGEMNQRYIDGSRFRDCGATRSTSDSVVIFPLIRTSRGQMRFPFCNYTPCDGRYGEPYRPRSSIVMTVAPTGWGVSNPGEYAVMPELGATQVVSVTAPLASGAISTSSVAIPPVE